MGECFLAGNSELDFN